MACSGACRGPLLPQLWVTGILGLEGVLVAIRPAGLGWLDRLGLGRPSQGWTSPWLLLQRRGCRYISLDKKKGLTGENCSFHSRAVGTRGVGGFF